MKTAIRTVVYINCLAEGMHVQGIISKLAHLFFVDCLAFLLGWGGIMVQSGFL